MQTRLQSIDAVTREFQTLCNNLSTDQLNAKPDTATWSIAQVLDHIITVNSTYYPILDDVEQGIYHPPFHARFGFIVSYLGRFILDSVQPENRKKIKTFPVWEPAKSNLPADILNRFTAHQEKLKNRMLDAEKWIQQGVVIHSPASKIIVYKLDTAFDIITAHEKRHLQQAQEIKQILFG